MGILIPGGDANRIKKRQVITTSGTWTAPQKLLYASIEVDAIGGGQNGTGTQNSDGKRFKGTIPVTPGQVLTVLIGAAASGPGPAGDTSIGTAVAKGSASEGFLLGGLNIDGTAYYGRGSQATNGAVVVEWWEAVS
ncbi:hypothetical protein SAMN02745857_03883 [Andreprevotia lacus DSM 23236]|jgi:hypothetical protein|uniref:Uncharacterized protein n=1 Tax=Andreprevotia lacus DSM 23236 TaxID=1121001 RepID=A0A1W1Y054_9NEIS|nr:hypothetical protein [Andreprevotia lacus]SMC29514.1 hypothetical protein SAMN02745857_03883 [Andreprevotia lacus DSM 23236]